MGLVSGAWLLVLGMLGAMSLVIARRPDAKHVIAALAPYQGWIGAVSALWAVWSIVFAVLNVGFSARAPMSWSMQLAVAVLQLSLGVLLGAGVVKTFIRHPSAQVRMDHMLLRLAPRQGRLGILCMAMGAWIIVMSLV
jgi:hypothetical protein